MYYAISIITGVMLLCIIIIYLVYVKKPDTSDKEIEQDSSANIEIEQDSSANIEIEQDSSANINKPKKVTFAPLPEKKVDPYTKLHPTYSNNTVINKVLPDLYISNNSSSRDYGTIKSLGIKQILSVGYELAQHTEFPNLKINVSDESSVDIGKYFEQCAEFIDKAPTLVHCQMGISRSATIIIAYLILRKGYTLESAIKHLKSVRHVINPNPGFMEQLQKLKIDN